MKIIVLACLIAAASLADAQQDSLADVFPLAISNSWTYSIRYESIDIESGAFVRDSGQATLVIIDTVSLPDTTGWIIEAHRTYQHAFGDYRRDTSYFVDRTDTMVLYEVQSGRHHLINSANTLTFDFQWDALDTSRIYRYQSIDSSGNSTTAYPFDYGHGSASFSFQQGVGMTRNSISDSYFFSWGQWATLLSSTVTSVHSQRIFLSDAFRLDQNYPNPSNPSTEIRYLVPVRSFVTLSIYDVLGRTVATLVNEEKPAGEYTIRWNAEGMPSGVYFYRMQARAFTATKKLLIIR